MNNGNGSFFEKISGIYQRYVVNNKYLNEAVHYAFVGMGFILGTVFVLLIGKSVTPEIFKRYMSA